MSVTAATSGNDAYSLCADASQQVADAQTAAGTITAVKPLGVLDFALPPLAWFRMGAAANADISTSAAKQALIDQASALINELDACAMDAANAGDSPIGDALASRVNADLSRAQQLGVDVRTTAAQTVANRNAVTAPVDQVQAGAQAAATGAGSLVGGAGKGVGATLGAAGSLLRWLPIVLVVLAVLGGGFYLARRAGWLKGRKR